MDSTILKQQLLYTPFYSWAECKRRYGTGQVDDVIVRLCQNFLTEEEMLMIGNEVMYQITRAYDDPHPEEGVYVNYIEEITRKLDNENYWKTTIVGIMLILDFQVALPDKIIAFLSQLRSLTIENYYFRSEFAIIKEELAYKVSLNIDFTPCPVAPKALLTDKDQNSWKTVTDNFYQPSILKILSRYKSKKDQRMILKMIKAEFDKTEVSYQEFLKTVRNHFLTSTVSCL